MAASTYPYKVSANEWYFIYQGNVYGSYHNEQEAKEALEAEIRRGKPCPNCED